MDIEIHKFASATARVQIGNPARVVYRPFPRIGDVIVVRALTENPRYPNLELVGGRLERVVPGDVIAGVVGSRQALRGFVGYAPMKVNPDDELSLLNMGGVVGRFLDGPPDLGTPVRVRVLGLALRGENVINVRDGAIEPTMFLTSSRPVVLVIGTCMNVGKTVAASRLIQELAGAGLKVAGAKLCGIAAEKDLAEFKSAGATKVLSFLDAGYPSTVDASDIRGLVKGILGRLSEDEPDAIVAELGDGILGRYRVEEVLTDPTIMEHVASVVVCAGDIVGAYGAREILRSLGVVPNVFSGPATDTVAGSEFIEERLNVRAVNVLKNPQAIGNLVLEALRAARVEK